MKQVFASKYTDRKVTAAQKMAEIICEKLARKEKIAALPERFWNLPRWEKEFKKQVFHANSLLKLYSAEAIFAALRHPKAQNVYSLGAAFVLDDIFRLEQTKIDKQVDMPAPEEREATKEKARPVFQRKKSTFSKLKGLDDGERTEEGGSG